MADPLSNMQNSDSMEHGPDEAVNEALKVRRKRKRVPSNIAASNLPPSKLACALGENLLKNAFTIDAQTSCQYGPAAAAGMPTPTRGAKGGSKVKMSTGDGYGNAKTTDFASAASSGIAKMAMKYPDLMKAANEWMDLARKGLGDLSTKALAGFKGLDPTLRSSLGYGAGLGAAGLIGGGVKGMFDEKDDDEESRIGHILRSAGKWGGLGALTGAGGGALASEASRLAPELRHTGAAVLSGPTAIGKLPAELSRMHKDHTTFPRGTGREGMKIPGTETHLPELSQFGLSRMQGNAQAVDPVDSAVDWLTKSNSAKMAALAYPALAKIAAGPGPGGMPGAGNSAAVGAAPAGAMGSAGAAPAPAMAQAPMTPPPGPAPSGPAGAMPPPAPTNSGGMGLSTGSSGITRIGK